MTVLINKNYRAAAFIIGCLFSRALIALIAKVASNGTLRVMGLLGLIPAISFMVIYTFGLRKSGTETGGELIWWNELRPVHSLLYFTFAYLAITSNRNAWVPLFLDVCIGLIAWVIHRIKN